MTAKITDVPFKAEAFVVKYLQKDSLNNINSNNDNTDTTRITVISNPFYLWIPQYVFHLPHYYVNHLSIPGINTSKILFVVDFSFVNTLDNAQYETCEKLNKIYNGYNKTTVAEFGNGNPYRNGIKVMSVDLKSALSAKGQKIVNLIDQNHVWKAINDAKVSHGSNDLNILVKTDNANKAFNRAVLQTHVNLTSKPLLLSLDYSSESISGKAIFYTEIKEIGGKIIWGARLHNTSGKTIFDTFVLPKETTNVHGIEISLHIITEQAGQHVLNVKRAIIS
jgi:hypothetical protein